MKSVKLSIIALFVASASFAQVKDAKIEAIYVQSPDKYQFWPIWAIFINNSNGQLKNDYGY